MLSADDLAYYEADSSCAHCGLRDSRVLTIHHLEQVKPKNEDYDNKLVLCHNCHHCYHAGKGPTADELNSIKRRLMMKAITIPGLNALKHAYRRGKVVAMPFLVNHLVEWRYLEAGAVTSQWVEDDDPPDSVNEIEVIYSLTQRGRSLLEKWGLA